MGPKIKLVDQDQRFFQKPRKSFLCSRSWQWRQARPGPGERCGGFVGLDGPEAEMLCRQPHHPHQGSRIPQTKGGEVDEVTGKQVQRPVYTKLFVGPFAGCVSQKTPSSDWLRPTTLFQRTSEWRGSQMCNICHKYIAPPHPRKEKYQENCTKEG